MNEFMEASSLIQQKAHDDANIIVGALFDDSLQDEMRVTVIATGVNGMEETISINRPAQALTARPQTQEKESEIAPRERVASSSMNKMSKSASRRNTGTARKHPLPLPNFLDEAELETPTYLRKAAD